jgi:cbb3-type cytochrome oxidase subunit 3
MRLSDIISHLNLTTYPIAGLVIFLGVFILVSARALSRRRVHEHAHAASLPLADDTGQASSAATGARP